jgi:hypothetical protein
MRDSYKECRKAVIVEELLAEYEFSLDWIPSKLMIHPSRTGHSKRLKVVKLYAELQVVDLLNTALSEFFSDTSRTEENVST